MPLLMQWRAIEIQTPVQLNTAAPVLLRADQPSIHMHLRHSNNRPSRRTDWKAIAETVYLGTNGDFAVAAADRDAAHLEALAERPACARAVDRVVRHPRNPGASGSRHLRLLDPAAG